MSYYLYNLINRYDLIDTLDLVIPNDIEGKFGFTSIRLLAQRGTEVRLLTTSSIEDIYFRDDRLENLRIKELRLHPGLLRALPQLGYTMVINSKDVHADKLGENLFSNDPIVVSDIQSAFDSLWNADESTQEKGTESPNKPISKRRRNR
jgi:hypothetical protein